MLTPCLNCKTHISNTVPNCPHCGCEQRFAVLDRIEKSAEFTGAIATILAFPLVFCLLIVSRFQSEILGNWMLAGINRLVRSLFFKLALLNEDRRRAGSSPQPQKPAARARSQAPAEPQAL